MTLHRVRCLCQRIPFNSLQGLTKNLSALVINQLIDPSDRSTYAGITGFTTSQYGDSSEDWMKGFDENGEAFCRSPDTQTLYSAPESCVRDVISSLR